MVAPLVFLALLAIGVGWWNVTGGFSHFMGHEVEHAAHGFFGGLFGAFTHTVNGVPLPLIGLLVALFGIFMAYVIYNKQWLRKETLGRVFGPLYTLVFRKYFFDELYENIIVKLVLMKGLFTGFSLFDSKGVDGVVNGVADGVTEGGRYVRRAQTGQLQLYGLFIGIGVAVIALCVYLAG
jgi:NADH-quinone oxidoreductase subunit L